MACRNTNEQNASGYVEQFKQFLGFGGNGNTDGADANNYEYWHPSSRADDFKFFQDKPASPPRHNPYIEPSQFNPPPQFNQAPQFNQPNQFNQSPQFNQPTHTSHNTSPHIRSQPTFQQHQPISPELLTLFAALISQIGNAPPMSSSQSISTPAMRAPQSMSRSPSMAPIVGHNPDASTMPASAPTPKTPGAPVRFLKRHRNTEAEIEEKAPAPQSQVMWQDQDDPLAVVEIIKRRCMETGLVLTKTHIEAELEKMARLQLKTIPRLTHELKVAQEGLLESTSKKVHWDWAMDRIRRAQNVSKGQPQFKAVLDQLIGAPEGPGAEGA